MKTSRRPLQISNTAYVVRTCLAMLCTVAPACAAVHAQSNVSTGTSIKPAIKPAIERAIKRAIKPAIITGTILGSNGKPLRLANAQLRVPAASSLPELAIVRTDAQGRFAIATTYTGAADLWLTGVDHDTRRVFLQLEPGFQLELHAKLAHTRYAASFDAVRAVGEFNNFRPDSSARVLKRNANGTYSIDIPVTGDTVAYILLGVAQRGFTNGTDDDAVNFSRAGYRSVARVVAGQARITFDPARIVRDTTSSTISYVGMTSARVARLGDSIAAHEALASSAERAGKTVAPEVWASIVRRTTNELATEKSPPVRRMLLTELIALAQFGAPVPPRFGRLALREMNATSPAWNTTQSFTYALPMAAAWVADSTLSLMRPQPVPLSSADSARMRVAAQHFAARADSMIAVTPIPDHAAQWMQFGAAITNGFDQSLTARFLGRMQAEYPSAELTSVALQLFGSKQAVRKGKQLPAFDIAVLDDTTKRVTKQSVAGKTVLIDVWATWCGPCIGEMSYLHDAYREFKHRGLEIVSISLDDSTAAATNFRATRWPMPWVNAWAAGGLQSPSIKPFELFGIPRAMLIGPDGTVIALDSELRGLRLRATLDRLLKPAPN